MDTVKRGRGRPRGTGPCGAIRILLENMAAGDYITLKPARFGIGDRKAVMYANASGQAIGKEFPGITFTTMRTPDGVWVRRLS